jgi:hypothetical protein
MAKRLCICARKAISFIGDFGWCGRDGCLDYLAREYDKSIKKLIDKSNGRCRQTNGDDSRDCSKT